MYGRYTLTLCNNTYTYAEFLIEITITLGRSITIKSNLFNLQYKYVLKLLAETKIKR